MKVRIGQSPTTGSNSVPGIEKDVTVPELASIIDAEAVQSLMNDFYRLVHIPMALLDLKSNVLVSVGWQDICTKFHRISPETSRHCTESDIKLSTGVAPGKYKLYKCKNNIWDVVTPVMVEGQHIGNIFSGQFFFEDEPLDYELYRYQARKYGFNEEEYIKALEKVPRLSREAVDTSMAFFMAFANMISQLSYSNIRLSQSLAERDAVVKELHESEKRERARSNELAAVLDAVPVAVYTTHDTQALKITGNRLSYEWLRVPVGTNFSKSAPEEEKPVFFKLVKDGVEIPPEKMPSQMAAAGIEVNDCELDIVSADGEVRHVLGNARPLRDEHGNLRGSISAFIDITEREKVEEALRLSNLYNRSLIEASLDPLVTIGRDGKITDVNNATEKVTGCFRRELIGTDFSNYFTEPEKAREGYQKVFINGEVRDYPLEIQHKDGHTTPVLYNASVYRDEKGEVIGVFAAARDITEQKRHEANLAFLAEIDEDFARLTSVDEIMKTVGEKIGKYLNVKTFNVCEVDYPEGILTINFGWQEVGVPNLVNKVLCIYDYLPEGFSRANRAGEPFVIRDTQTDPRTNSKAYAVLEVGSVMIIPFQVKDEWKAFLSVTDKGPRDWLKDEIELFQELSNRIFQRIERARAKEALRESEERFRALVTASSEIVYHVSPDWSEMRQLYGRGFLADTEIPSSAWLQEYVPLEDQPRLTAVVNEAIRTKSTYQLEHQVLLADGSLGWIFSRAVPILDANGEIVEWFGAASDITERKRVEEALRESEERLRLLSDNLPDSAVYQYVHELDGSIRFLYFSTGIERLNGVSVSDVLRDPNTLYRQVPPDYLKLVFEAEALSAREFSDFDMELPMRLPDGQMKWMRIHSRPRRFPDGRIIWDGVQIDITKQKQAEEDLKKVHDNLEKLVAERTAELEKAYISLKESEKSLAEAQRMAHIGNWEWDIITGKTYLSAEIYRILGLDPQKLAQNHNRFFDYVHPNDRDLVDNAIKKALNEKPFSLDYRIITASGEERTVHVESEVTFDPDNRPIRMKGIIQDITERKKAEETLENIETARKKEIHHRIKNNLQVISSLLDLQADKFDDPTVIEAFRESQNRVISMALIHEELYKGEGTDTLEFSRYIKELAESLFQTYSLKSKNIHLLMELEEKVFLNMDTGVPLGIIVNELVSNSLKHAFPGKASGEIRIELRREEDGKHKKESDKAASFILIVSDNGIGIPENLNIEVTDSLGIQLITALVEQLDGEFELKRNKGTEFTIKFTVTEENNQASNPAV